MHTLIRKLVARRDEDGASAVEYGLLVAAIAAFIVLIVFALGGVVRDVFKQTCDSLKVKANTSSTCDT